MKTHSGLKNETPIETNSDGDGIFDAYDPDPKNHNVLYDLTDTFSVHCQVADIATGDGNPHFVTNITVEPELAGNIVSVKQVRVTGSVDDAFKIDGTSVVWTPELSTFTDFDVTSFISDWQKGTFTLGIYDWTTNTGGNAAGFDGTFTIDYVSTEPCIDLVGYDADRNQDCDAVAEEDEVQPGIFIRADDGDPVSGDQFETKLLVKAVGKSGLQRKLQFSNYYQILKVNGTDVIAPFYTITNDSNEDVELEVTLNPIVTPGVNANARYFVMDGTNMLGDDAVSLESLKVVVDVHSVDTNTHKIPSILENGKDHYVCVKNTGLITLNASLQPNDPALQQRISWEATGATIVYPAVGTDTRTASLLSSTAQRIPVRMKIDEMIVWDGFVWIVWCSGTSTNGPIQAIDHQGYLEMYAEWDFEWIVTPPEICYLASDIPDLTGANTTPPENASKLHIIKNLPLSGGVQAKWDESRQARYKVINPQLFSESEFWYVSGNYYDNQPIAIDVPEDYPSSMSTEGNDDLSTDDPENNDPCSNGGIITGYDKPRQNIMHSTGNVGDTLEERYQFREFVRLELGGIWYRVSDFLEWRVHFKMKKNSANRWVNDGSTQGANNEGF